MTTRSLLSLFITFASPLFSSNAIDLVWIGGTGNWNAAGNWNPAQLPTSADNAWITNAGDYTVTIPAGFTAAVGTLVVGGATGSQILSLDRATLTLAGSSQVRTNGQLALTVSQSVLNGAGDLIVSGTLDWANGTMSGTGLTTIGSGGILTIGSGGVSFGRTLNHGGNGTWSGGNLAMSSGVSFNVLAGATFDITADGKLTGGLTTPVNNSGLFRQTAGTAGTAINVPFNNNGTLQVLATTLSLGFGGTHGGTFNINSGDILAFSGGSHILASGSLVTGAGVLAVSGNATTLSASGTFDLGSTLNVGGGAVTLGSGCIVGGASLNIAGGILSYNSAGTAGTVTLTSGILGGISPLTVTGLLTLSGGSITNALVTANGGLSISGNVTLNGGKLVNPGTAVWNAGNFIGANGAVFSNLFGATFENTFDGNAASGAGAAPLLVNAGSFRKTGGTAPLGTTSIDFTFINTGLVEVQTNTLRYGANQQTAGLTLLDGGDLAAQASSLQFLGGSLMGTGLVSVANTLNLVNAAGISPGLPTGKLDVTGNFQQTLNGSLTIDLGGYEPGTNYDLITVTAGGAGGTATLGGTLNVNILDGFSPTNGATFTFLTAISRVGAFGTFNYPSNDFGMQVSYDTTSTSVKIVNLRPIVANPILNPPAISYGTAFNMQFSPNTFSDPDNDALTYTASGLPSGITFDAATRTFSGTASQAGAFTVLVVAHDGGTPSLAVTNQFDLTVNPAVLAVIADPQTKPYGDTDPALSFAVTGFQLSDTAATVLTGGLARTSGESAGGGPYAITQGTLTANSNYMISFTGNALTIIPVPLLITADGQNKTYGAADPLFTASYSGFVNNETPAVLNGTLTFSRAPGENAGSYAITPAGLSSDNYTITFAPGSLSINKAPLAITADDKTKTYGAADPSFSVAYAGFVNGETFAVLGGSLTFTRAPGENVGNYSITPAGLTGGNYALTFNSGTLSITRAALSVTADDKSKIYGADDPTFTAAYAGFVNGETAAVLGGTLTLNRAPGENVGTYAITPAGLSSGNYALTFVTGTLTVTQAALTVTAEDKTKAYGTADPPFTAAYTGFVNGETAAVLGGTLTLNRAPGENVGTYAITPAGLSCGNYALTFVTGTLTVSQAALTVTAEDKTKAYGAADPTFTAAYAGFVNGETAAVLGGTLSFSRAPGENVGTYAVTAGGLTSSNYAITFNSGTLSITKAPLSVTADDKSKIFGTPDPIFTATYTGFVNGESPAVLEGSVTFNRTPGEDVGVYTITPGGITSSNYTIAFNPGALHISPAPPITLSLSDAGITDLRISWDAISNTTYRIQYVGNVTETNWADLPGDVLALGPTGSKTDRKTLTNRFYRLQVRP